VTEKFSALIRRLLGRPDTGNNLRASRQIAAGVEDATVDTEDDFPNEMYVKLLLELPAHRRDLLAYGQAGDLQRLRDCVHRLLGATVYCAAPELEDALRDLRSALHTGNSASISQQHARTLSVIDTTLGKSGSAKKQS
jgi:hypothetical protein